MNEKARILMLEDDQDYIDILGGYLRNDFDVYPARSLEEARVWLRQRTFHLAIVDISLVVGDPWDEKGFRLIEKLRNTEILRDMSIIVVTGYPTNDRVRKAFKDYKVFDFIDKTKLDPEEFKREVADAIARSYTGAP